MVVSSQKKVVLLLSINSFSYRTNPEIVKKTAIP